jgi:hypothetical protein
VGVKGRSDEPSINNRLCEWRVICIPLRQSPAAPGTEDEHEIATVALEVFAGWVSTGVRSRDRGVAKGFERRGWPVGDLVGSVLGDC